MGWQIETVSILENRGRCDALWPDFLVPAFRFSTTFDDQQESPL